MQGNTFGTLFRLTSFGESHGASIGGVIEGCPAGLVLDLDFIQEQLSRRRPGQSKISTQRKEDDKIEFMSGVFEGKTTGMPLTFIIKNKDAKSKDYTHIKDKYRPSHAGFTYEKKYGIRDYRGGGRSSARETAVRVAAGAVAQLLLRHFGISIIAYVSQVYDIALAKPLESLDLSKIETNAVRCPDPDTAAKMEALIAQVKKEGDSLGGVITCVTKNCPIGLGEPVYQKFHAILGAAILGINACKGFDVGSGFGAVLKKGSEHNDIFINKNSKITTKTNHAGGVLGGITNGNDIVFRAAFKPVATIMQKQKTVNTKGEVVEIEGKGRHDPCVVPRAVPIVEAMTALVIADFLLLRQGNRLEDFRV